MSAAPKLDPRTKDALERLKNSPDFLLFVKHQQAQYEYHKEVLVTCNPVDVPRLQGRASYLQDLLSDITKDSTK